MVVCVVGDVDVDEVFKIVDEKILKDRPSGNVKNIFADEPKSIKQDYIEAKASVSLPLFDIGFKDNYLKTGDEILKRETAVELISRLLVGRSSKLFQTMYESGLVNDTFGTDNSTEPQFACAAIGGESENPQEVKRLLLKEIENRRKNGFSDDEFMRVKKAFYGSYLRAFNNVETVGNMITRYILNGVNIFSFKKIYDSINSDYITEVFDEIFREENMALSVVFPSDK